MAREPDSLLDLHTGDIPIVHRVMKVHEKASGAVELLTKGDNNRVDDRGLYAPGQLWLERDDVLGRAVGISAQIMSCTPSMRCPGIDCITLIG